MNLIRSGLSTSGCMYGYDFVSHNTGNFFFQHTKEDEDKGAAISLFSLKRMSCCKGRGRVRRGGGRRKNKEGVSLVCGVEGDGTG